MVIDEQVVSVISNISRHRGEKMLDSITLSLADVIQAEHVFMARLNSDYTQATTESYVNNGVIAANFTYDLKHTPCAIVSENNICCYNGNVQQHFPEDQLLIDMGIKSYIGIPLMDSNLKLFGLMVALFESEIESPEKISSLFTIFSGLVAGDIERHEKQVALNISTTIISEMSEAVVLANENYEILSCNQAFTELTGFTEKEILGKPSDILKSGYQDQAFYKSFWDSINKTGNWEGELYNKKKSGELYPEYMRIRRIKESDSGAIYYLIIHKDITDLKHALDEAYFNKNFDGLTHLPNRHLFLDRLNLKLKHNERHDKKSIVISLDLDGYQNINSTMGHDLGNRLLRLFAERLTKTYRDTDIVGHLGSDEFAIYLDNITDTFDAEYMANKLISIIKEPFYLNVDSEPTFLTASLGIAFYPDDSTVNLELLEKADQALSYSKTRGKDRFEFFSKSIQHLNEKRLSLNKRLRAAIENQELSTAFQPIICAQTGKIIKLEALARWPSDGDYISPAEFIPIAESFGYCHKIGSHVLQQSCQLLKQLNDLGMDMAISVNRSVAEFKELNHDVSSWLDTIHQSSIRNNQIGFEITESLLASEHDSLRNSLYQLKDAGSPIFLDDFGTGFSSLSYLRSFPIDFLKIDRSFINDLGKNHEARSLVASIIAMSNALNIKTIAEGIESKRQLAILSSMDCNYYQGFYFAKPLFADELLKFLEIYSPDPVIFS